MSKKYASPPANTAEGEFARQDRTNVGVGEALVIPPKNVGEVLDNYRQYLLAIALAEMPAHLTGKVGASDIVQESILRGYQHFGTFQGTTSQQLGCWLRAILRNHLANVAKAYATDRRDVRREQPVDSRISPVGQQTPSQTLLSAKQRDLVSAALSRLSEESQQVIRWRHCENLSFAEIGCRLTRSEDTARRVWARAIEQLQAELQSRSGEVE